MSKNEAISGDWRPCLSHKSDGAEDRGGEVDLQPGQTMTIIEGRRRPGDHGYRMNECRI